MLESSKGAIDVTNLPTELLTHHHPTSYLLQQLTALCYRSYRHKAYATD